MKSNKKKLIILLAVAFLILVIGITYAFFAINIGPDALTNINIFSKTTDNLYFTNGPDISLRINQVNLAEGGTNVEATTSSSATLKANNKTNSATDTYNVYFQITKNEYQYSSYGTPEILLTVIKPDGTNLTTISGLNYVTSGGVSGFDITKKKGLIEIAEDYSITSTNTTTGVSQNWTFKVTYLNLTIDQGINEDKELLASVKIQKEKETNLGTFANQILANNDGATVIEAKETPDFSKVAVSQTYYDTLTESTYPKQSEAVVENGMYAAPDDYGTSYYFRGAVDNNWVKFANMYWRIIRINGDGSVRMIYTGTTDPTEAQKVVMTGTGTQIGYPAFNSSYDNDNMSVGYMYTSGEVHGLGTPSTIKGTIDSWYEANLLSQTNSLADNLFCNDRSAYTDWDGTTTGGGTGTTYTYYGAYIRNLTNKQPILTCPTQSDAFTVSDTTKGNGALDYPIGLITMDEMTMAGGVYLTVNTDFYLYTNSSFWLFSPCSYPGYNARGFFFDYAGYVSDSYVSGTSGGRAVVSLKSDILPTGSGTWDDPYIVF